MLRIDTNATTGITLYCLVYYTDKNGNVVVWNASDQSWDDYSLVHSSFETDREPNRLYAISMDEDLDRSGYFFAEIENLVTLPPTSFNADTLVDAVQVEIYSQAGAEPDRDSDKIYATATVFVDFQLGEEYVPEIDIRKSQTALSSLSSAISEAISESSLYKYVIEIYNRVRRL